jgi:RimJ/RimL family protein N-acetyltransferase
MKDAALALLTWATEEAGVEEVFVRVESSNGRSKGVVDKIPGFVKEEDQDIDWKGENRVLRMWRWKSKMPTA